MTSRSIQVLLENYEKARIDFSRAVSELAMKACNVPLLDQVDILDLLKPLLTDPSKQVQQYATVALGRIIQHDAGMGEKVLETDILKILLTRKSENKYQKSCVLLVLRAVCKHDAEMAYRVLQLDAMNYIMSCLENFEPTVKESAAWVTGYIARHNAQLAQECVDAGVVPLLILCLQEPHLSLKQIAASALSDIAKHSADLAQNIVDDSAIPYLAKNLNNLDEKLKRQVLSALDSCAKHSLELAELVVDSDIFPQVFMLMAHQCPSIRKNATILVKDVVRHGLELTQLIVNTGGIGALIEVLHQNFEECLIPAITALGYIAGHSDQLALAVLGCDSVTLLGGVLRDNTDDAVLSVTAWTIGQLGRHSPEHSKGVAAANLFPRLLQLYIEPTSSEDLKFKCKATLKMCLQKCLLLSALEPLLYEAPPNILKYILGQYSKVLPNDPKARRLFVTTGGLKKIQTIDAVPGTELMEHINVINSCFPIEIVRYYSPGYPESLLDKVEQYSPQIMTVLHETQHNDNEVQAVIDRSASRELQNLLVG